MSLHFIRGFRLVSIFCHAATGGRGDGGTGGVAMPVTIHFREVRFCCRATRRCRVTIHFREVTFVDGRNARRCSASIRVGPIPGLLAERVETLRAMEYWSGSALARCE